MVNETNLIVRKSGRKDNSYYIDCSGEYKISEIAKISGLKPGTIDEIYLNNGAVIDETLEVYYFNSLEAARKTVSQILSQVQGDYKGRLVSLTESEIEYIRKALINEGGNNIHMINRLKDQIFKKLNG